MDLITVNYFKTPVGELLLGSFEDQLCLCDWRYRKMRERIDRRIQDGLKAVYETGESAVLLETRKQLEEYFSGGRKVFDLPVLTVGSGFQKDVWNELAKVAYGTTSTYIELARRVGNEKAVRAVASANGANAISIIIPCHRVIGSDGELTGYAGGLTAKKKLLQLESDGELQIEMEFGKEQQ